MKLHNSHFWRIWQLSLLSFIIAALTGFLYRYGMLYPLPETLNFANIRHAHSHLMFFNWICPPIMVWMAAKLVHPSDDRSNLKFSHCLYTMLFLGFLSFPFFLFFGYHPVLIGSASLPLAAIISGFVMFTWYWFIWIYYSKRKHVQSNLSIYFFDGALVVLVISSLGAWGVSIFQFTDIDNPLIASAMTHFFLSVFTEGWAVLGILGILWSGIQQKDLLITIDPGWLWKPVLFGSMLIFPFSLIQTMVTPMMLYTAKAGLIMIVTGLSLNVYFLIKNGIITGWIWKSVLALLMLKILFQVMAIFPVDIWPGEHGLRVLYLHLLLLGFVSISLIESFQPEANRIAKFFFVISVLLIVTSLVAISGYWPPVLMLHNLFFWIMTIAFLPVIPAVWLWGESFREND